MSKKPPENQEIVTNPHDQFFREAMKDKRVSEAFLKRHLSADLCAVVDFKNLVLQPRSQSNAVRKESIVDLLFKTSIAGKEAYIYLLLEHQSSPEPLMAFRVLEYTVNAIRDHLKKHNTKKIPLILPLVIYHGRPYQFKRDINDLVDAPKDLVDQYFLKPFQLVDLNEIKDEELKQQMWSGAMEFALKHIFERDMLPYLREIAPVFKKIVRQGGDDFIGIVLQYIIESAELSDKIAFIELINTNISYEIGEKIMTVKEQWKQEGELKSKMEIARRMLAEGSDLAFITKVTGLSIAQIRSLQNN